MEISDFKELILLRPTAFLCTLKTVKTSLPISVSQVIKRRDSLPFIFTALNDLVFEMRSRLSVAHWLAVLTAILGSFSALAATIDHNVGDKNTATWCEAPDIAEEVQDVTITFYISSAAISQIFLEDLALSFTRFKDSEDAGETVYTCWVNNASSTFDCFPNAIGYNLNVSDSSNSMTLIISKASMKLADRYVLKTDKLHQDRFLSCNLTLRNPPRNEDVTFPDSTRKEGSVTFPNTTGSERDVMLLVTTRNSIPVVYIYLVPIIAVVAVAAAVAAVAAVVLIKKRKQGKRRQQFFTCCNRSLEDGQEKTAFNEKDNTFSSDTSSV